MTPVRRFRPRKDLIGVCSPSHNIANFPRRTERAVKNLEALTGSSVRFAANAKGQIGNLSGTAKQRTSDLEDLLGDPDIGMIICATGGYNSIDVALNLDLDLLRANPKPIVGLSDSTALLLDIFRRTELVTFHGPALLQNFGGADLPEWQVETLLSTVSGPTRDMLFQDPSEITTEFAFWDRAAGASSPRIKTFPRVASGGAPVEGRLIGGNLDTLVAMQAAGRWPSTSNALIFIEAAFGELEKVQRDLKVLDLAGVFETAAGLIFSVPFCVDRGHDLQSVVDALARSHRLPMLYGAVFGHASPILTIPMGALARLDPKDASLRLLEDVTTP